MILIFCPAAAISKNHSAVLICAGNCTINHLDALDVRRIFLGLKPINHSQKIKPIINRSNEKLYKDFLKNILHMTEDGYKRKIIKRVFRQGADYIKETSSIDKLVTQLNENPNLISFIRPEQASQYRSIKVVQILW